MPKYIIKNNNLKNNKSNNSNIDDEWEKFMNDDCDDDNTSQYSENDDSEESDEEIIIELNKNKNNNKTMKNVVSTNNNNNNTYNNYNFSSETPKPTEIYISTKTKIAYLNKTIDLKNIFWDIPIIPYTRPQEGVIKKQMKFNSSNEEDLEYIKEKLKGEKYFEEYVITSINNPNGRIKFKDIRKISVGMSKKDLISYRCKQKSAFYNCFVMIIRLNIQDTFKEFHIKVFNTGKLEIPGVQNEDTFKLILANVIQILKPHIKNNLNKELDYIPETTETVLINSNFNCGFYINREKLHDILKYKYNIQSIYDPCSYPGIQCTFYYNPDINMSINSGKQNGVNVSEENKKLYPNVFGVSFMIFRTGSVLIVGKCDEYVLMEIYEFLKTIFIQEYKEINQKMTKEEMAQQKDKTKKNRKKQIVISIDVPNIQTQTQPHTPSMIQTNN
jgi:hypothetical protein